MSKPMTANGVPAAALAELPPEARTFVQEMGYLEDDHLKVGDFVSPMELERLDGSGNVQLGGQGPSPTVLIFASYT